MGLSNYRVLSKDIILIATYKVLTTVLTKFHDPPSSVLCLRFRMV